MIRSDTVKTRILPIDTIRVLGDLESMKRSKKLHTKKEASE